MKPHHVKVGYTYPAIWGNRTEAIVEVIAEGLERVDITGTKRNDGLLCRVVEITDASRGWNEFEAGDELILTSEQLEVSVMDYIHILATERVAHLENAPRTPAANNALDQLFG